MGIRLVKLGLTLGLAALAVTGARAAQDILLADFEGDNYGDWKVEGEAFGPAPARGALPGQMPVNGFLGRGLVNSFYHGDATTGRLTSPPFKIERKYLNFLIGGGKHPGKAGVNLLVDGKAVRTATGPNDKPGGSEQLDWESWDLSDLAGKTAVVEIIDQVTGGWGHINVDEIIQSDTRKSAALVNPKRELVLSKRYLSLPVKTGGPKRKMSVLVENHPVREFEIELADGAPDFWTFLDVNDFQGKKAMLEVDRLPEDSRGLSSITQDDTPREMSDLYREKLRPQFHFSSRRGWLNDPNGLVFYAGEYHLYYQHNPYGWNWGNMHWGHAVSADLVHWKELPISLYPQKYGDWAFSGSAVVDRANTAGFKNGKEDVIVGAYTSTGRGECIVYSNDKGRTFTEFEGNPVIKHEGRDPKIVWYAPGKHWVIAVYDVQNGKNGIAFFTSTDLKKWERQSWIEGYYECPELFELPIDNDRKKSRWVLHAADGAYAVGSFDGKSFTPEGPKQPANWGNCFYASQTYSDIPEKDGRRIRVGWGTVAIPGMPFNQMMDFPVQLTLRSTEEGTRMFAQPVRELENLHARKHSVPAGALAPGDNPLAALSGDLFDIQAELEVGDAAEVRFAIRGVPVTYDVKGQKLTCGDKSAPLKPEGGRIRLQLLVDRTSIEIFGNGGRVYMPMGVHPKDSDRTLGLTAQGGAARIVSLTVHELRSAWE